MSKGRQLVIGEFGFREGRQIDGIVNEQGEVYEPSPYDIPQNPELVLAFALKFVLAMIDSGMIGAEEEYHGRRSLKALFVTKKDLLGFWESTRDLLRALENRAISGVDIRYQKSPSIIPKTPEE